MAGEGQLISLGIKIIIFCIEISLGPWIREMPMGNMQVKIR